MSDNVAPLELVNDSSPELSHPGRFFRRALSDLRVSCGLSVRLLSVSLRARYRQSIFGYLWLLATPASIAAVWIFLRRAGVITTGSLPIPYAVYVTTGVFLWTLFLRMLNAPLQQLQSNRFVLSKIGFPWESLLIAGWGEVIVEAVVFLIVLAAVYVVFGMGLINLIVAIPLVAVLLSLGAAIGLVTAPLGILYDDVPRALNVATYLLFFLTPVVYPPPTSMPGLLTVVANPISVLIVTSREIMTAQPVTFPALATSVAVCSLIVLVLGWIVFRLAVPHLVSKL